MTFRYRSKKVIIPSRINSKLSPHNVSSANLNLLNNDDWHGKIYLTILKNFSKKNNYSTVCYQCFNSFPIHKYTCTECKNTYSLCGSHHNLAMTLFSGNICVFCRRHLNVELMHASFKLGVKPDRYYTLQEDFYYDRTIKNIVSKIKKKHIHISY